jgi:hypothetical protein
MWITIQIIVDDLSFIVNACIFNQSHGLYWLLNDSLHTTIIMTLKV